MTLYFEPNPDTAFDPREVVTSCIESGAHSLLLDVNVLPPEFFDLSTGIAGELLHHLSKYRMRLAAVVPAPEAHSNRFGEFAREANRGEQFRFFPTRDAAIAWLSSESTRSSG